MKINKNAVIGLISSLRESYTKFLEAELKSHKMSGILSPHGSILACLYKNGGKMQVLEISRAIGRSKSSVPELIDRLVAFEYVEKLTCEQDTRISYVVLTEKGLSIKTDFDNISCNLINVAYRDFSEEEKEILVSLLEKMRKNFNFS